MIDIVRFKIQTVPVLIKNQPQYLAVAETLIRDIGQNKYPLGGLLPPEIELATAFGVSRNTMRAAMRVLVDMGLVSRRAGMGTVVQARAVTPNFVQAIESVDQLYPGMQKTEQSVLARADVTADDELALLLASAPGTSWVRFDTVRRTRRGQPPVCAEFVYVAPALRAIENSLNKLRKPAYTVLESASKQRISDVIQQSDAVLVDEHIASILDVPVGSAALRTVRRFVAEDGKVAMVTDTFYPSGQEHFTIRFRASWPGTAA